MSLYKNKYRNESSRLQNRDYSKGGSYFITIVTKNMNHYFGNISNNKMHLLLIGKIAYRYWNEIPKHFPNVKLDEFVIMPNHVHGIITINYKKECDNIEYNVPTDTPNNSIMSKISPKKNSLGTIIRSYKSAVTRFCHQNNHKEFEWHSNFYEHVIRKKGFTPIKRYIANNVRAWQK